jgi:hypothetical protein
MRKTLILLITFLLFKLTSQSQFIEWGIQFGPDYRGIQPKAITSDDFGNAIVIGLDQTGMTDISSFVRKYNAAGALILSVGFNDNNSCHSLFQFNQAASDPAGNIYVIGYTQCPELKLLNFQLMDTINYNIGNFLLKLNPQGQISYLINVPDERINLDVDSSGNCYLVGNDGIQKYNKQGLLKWNKTTIAGIAIDVSSSGKVFVTNGTSTWKLNTIGNITWENNTIGGLGIAYHEAKNKLYIINSLGTIKIQPNWNAAQPTFIPNLVGTKIFCDTLGNLFSNGNGQINKKAFYNATTKSINSYFGLDFTVSKNGLIYSLGRFNNRQDQISYCNFMSVKQGPDPTIIGSDDGYLAKISFEKAPFVAIYNYTSACLNQVNPISHCTDRIFNPNNNFKVELSDDKGSFDKPIYVGAENNVVLPNNLPSGNNYRFRIKSTSPVFLSIPTQAFEILPYQGPLTINKIGVATLCDSGYIHFRANNLNGLAVNCDWYADFGWNYDWQYQSTGTDFNTTLDGNYYAVSTVCYSVSNNLDADHNCRIEEKNSNEIEVIVYPNPSSECFTIELTSQSKFDQVEMKLFDIAGRELEIINYEMNTKILLGQSWQTGMYFIKYNSQDESGIIKLMKSK